MKTSQELDLRDTKAVHAFFKIEKPEYIFLAAAKVGGISANNTYRGEFLYDNLMIQNNVIHNSYLEESKNYSSWEVLVFTPKKPHNPCRKMLC